MVRNDASFYPRTVANTDKGMSEPLFTSSFPTPPRRQAPSLHDVPFDDDHGGATFRHADSTSRALAALAQSRYEKMERQRAMTLVGVLVCVAFIAHGASGGYGLSSFAGPNSSIREGVNSYAGAMELRPNMLKGGGGPNIGRGIVQQSNNATNQDVVDEGKLRQDAVLASFSRISDSTSNRLPNEVPLFWHVPRSAGSTVKDLMGQCLGLVAASEVGVREGHENDPEVRIIDVQGVKYVNVDTTSLDGIMRAKEIGLAQSGLADVVVSSYLTEVSSIFTNESPGRAFTLLRDPIQRAVSMYYYRSGPYGDLHGVTLEQYASGNGIENNWMTRYLVNKMEGELEKEHLEHAKAVLQQKFLIGFMDDFEESMYRFMKYNGWVFSENDTEQLNQEECIKTLTQVGVHRNDVEYTLPQRGTQAYALITWQTQYDMKLYDFAKGLFNSQTKAWGSKERKKADKKKKES